MSARVENGIDGAWLARLSAEDPVRHAWAVWDRLVFPDRVEFRTLVEDGVPTAYLLIWHGSPKLRVVHWIGAAKDPRPLLDAFPPRPLIAVVPESLGIDVERRCAPSKAGLVRWMEFDPGRSVPPVPPRRARRLVPSDQADLRQLARNHPDVLTQPYAQADLAREPTFGAFDWGRLGAVARAQVALPTVWVIGGVFTVPELRGRHLGTDVMHVAVRAALDAGARPSLFVREENAPARRIYERMGFRLFERRVWIDAVDAE
jgi:GNAT superfamily N-acetyltransferase